MRLIIKCQHCQTQYDATGHAIGSRFHCICGHVVVVLSPKDEYNIKVLRCSNCGAASDSDSDSCKYCDKVFSLVDRNLTTMCPHCTERVADHAQFCHRCGNEIRPVEAVGEISQLACSNCDGKALTRRILGSGIGVFECESCTGIWLDHPSFASIEKDSVESVGMQQNPGLSLELGAKNAKSSNRSKSFAKKTHYRKCPKCRDMMLQKNYQRTSGILVDVCGPHGIWFGEDNLARVIQWLESGGYHKTKGKREALDNIVKDSISAKKPRDHIAIHSRWEHIDTPTEGLLATLIRITFED